MTDNNADVANAMRHGDIETAVAEIDGMNHYAVTLDVSSYDTAEEDIRINLWKDNSTRHVQSTRLYYGTAYYDDTEQWRCVMFDNYAVVDKALETLNEAVA